MNEKKMQESIMNRLKKPFSFAPHPVEVQSPSGEKKQMANFRICDANDDPVARTHEQCYATMIVDALNHKCPEAGHVFTKIAPEMHEDGSFDAEPNIWQWCIRCGTLELNGRTYTPGPQQKDNLVEDK